MTPYYYGALTSYRKSHSGYELEQCKINVYRFLVCRLTFCKYMQRRPRDNLRLRKHLHQFLLITCVECHPRVFCCVYEVVRTSEVPWCRDGGHSRGKRVQYGAESGKNESTPRGQNAPFNV